ncbi:DUF1934 domain-containing protein [Paenibacillus sp. GSMTC-2017]|uniref:DUF1934 domain-containing protein n=1 Tax=Paenibacillus sp. GSMTC-2017 TaxID=2794350 RepID=UPI0018D73193|nr:DUF1934 domain-containing protein [Paenibacillus sp. GSMTC-2017]MBH5319848.1 DUF1934 domain-containing protein [Paenibacillus sp. GSMTC-2017]
MKDSGKAIIILESKVDGEKGTHRYKGEWFRKQKSIFIRYAEDEATRSLIRYSPNELSIKRSGAVQSEQLFVAGQSRSGTYRSAAAAFNLETHTKLLVMHAKASVDHNNPLLPSSPPFTLEWRYELFVSEQMSGRFHIRLHIQEDHEA